MVRIYLALLVLDKLAQMLLTTAAWIWFQSNSYNLILTLQLPNSGLSAEVWQENKWFG